MDPGTKAAPGHQAGFELFTIFFFFSPYRLEGELVLFFFFSFWFEKKTLQEMI